MEKNARAFFNKMVNEKLLAQKKKMNRKRPKFVRQDYYHRMRVHDEAWKRPRGYHSKMRRGEAGKRKVVQAGYGSPAELRGINLQGFRPVHVETMKQLEKLNPKEESAIIAANLGMKNRIKLVKHAAEKNIRISNIKDAKKFIADADAHMKARKEARKTAVEKRTTKKEEKTTHTKSAKPTASEQEKKEAKKEETKIEVKSAAPVEHAKTHGDINSQTVPKGVSKT